MKHLILITLFSVNANALPQCWVLPKLQDGCFEVQYNNLRPRSAFAKCPIINGKPYTLRCGIEKNSSLTWSGWVDTYEFDQVLHDKIVSDRLTARSIEESKISMRVQKLKAAQDWCDLKSGKERAACDIGIGR